jgi:hypothetical protein
MTDPNIAMLGFEINRAQIPLKCHERLRPCKLPSAQYFLIKECNLAQSQTNFLHGCEWIKPMREFSLVVTGTALSDGG